MIIKPRINLMLMATAVGYMYVFCQKLSVIFSRVYMKVCRILDTHNTCLAPSTQSQPRKQYSQPKTSSLTLFTSKSAVILVQPSSSQNKVFQPGIYGDLILEIHMAGCTRGKIIIDENFVVPVHLGMEGGQERKKWKQKNVLCVDTKTQRVLLDNLLSFLN